MIKLLSPLGLLDLGIKLILHGASFCHAYKLISQVAIHLKSIQTINLLKLNCFCNVIRAENVDVARLTVAPVWVVVRAISARSAIRYFTHPRRPNCLVYMLIGG
jgi:hypothetical protein